MGGKGSAPPPPDYIGAANTQAAASKELTNIQNFANRPTINTPFGSQSWQTSAQVDPATGQTVTSWTQNNTLAPALQSALNAQIGLQNDRSQLAGNFMDRVASEYQRPFDYANLPQMAEANPVGNLQTNVGDYARGLQTGVDSRANNVVSGFNFAGPQMGMSPMTGGLNYGVSQQPLNTGFSGMTGDLTRGTGTESLQRSLATGDNPDLPQIDSGYRDRVADQLMQRMQPVHNYQQQQLEARLANQGFTVGSEAYNRALTELQQRQANERFNALDQAGNEAQRLFGMQMGARQQAFNEDVSGGNFFNQAANQAFNQGLSANQFANQATGQAFNQAMQAQQAGNQALGQQFQQNVTNANLNNQAINQAYGQTLGAFNFGNQAQNQAYNQMMGQANLANQAAGQAFNQDLQARQFGNQALGQASALDVARMQAQNQAAAQQFGLNQQFADSRNRLRQQAIAEQMQRRGMSLNEMNALLSGQQVNMPNMPSFAAAQRSETPNILGATQMGYDAALGSYNAQQAGFGNLLGAGAQLGSAAFMFSDRRLKSNLKRVGTHATGVGIYDYTMMGMPQRGVIAQEVERVRPDLVKRHANGYLMVNYGGLQ
jgi:hypothetical protein